MKYFFASDVHLGLQSPRGVKQTEELFVKWLQMVHKELLLHPMGERGLFLVGDIFDFWFEYKYSVPKGFIDTLYSLKQMSLDGIDIYMFCGNHDAWHRGYLENEVGAKLIKEPNFEIILGESRFHIEHGDAIFARYKFASKVLYTLFSSTLIYRLFSFFTHSDLVMSFGSRWSKRNRGKKSIEHKFTGESEPMAKFARECIAAGHDTQYFVFGHLHGATRYKLNSTSEIIILGQWIDSTPIYGVYDDLGFRLEEFE